MIDRIPPQSIEMEQALLGSFLSNPSVMDSAVHVVKVADFYREANGIIFDCMTSLSGRHEPIDLFTLQEEMRNREVFESCGGLVYLSQLSTATVTPSNAPYYAKVVRDKSILRKIEKAGKALQELVHGECENIETVLADAESAFTQATTDLNTGSTSEGIKSIMQTAYEQIEEWADNKKAVTGISTGIDDLDYLTRGWQAENLIVVGARPSQGKTALGAHFAVTAAKNGHTTYIVSQEMSKKSIALRLIQSVARVDGHRMRTGYLSVDDWQDVNRACATLEKYPITISERALSLSQLRSECRKLARIGLELVVVDYLQLMKVEGKSENRTNEVSMLAEGLHDLAVELKVSIIALSQLSRAVETRVGNRPVLADLRDSGQVEAAADVVLFPFNPLAHQPDDKRLNCEEVELIVAKQRDGMTGSAKALWFREYTAFGSLAKNYEGQSQ